MDYKADLVTYQKKGRLIQGEIESYLLCTSVNNAQRQMATNIGVVCTAYNPEQVLKFFYDNFKPIAFFSERKPIDIGIWNIHLINELMYLLETTNDVDDLRQRIKNAPRTLYNKIKFASELHLIDWIPHSNNVSLSPLGKEYVERKDPILPERLSEAQSDLIRKFVMQNPYESSVVLGIASIVESVFTLSKNTYPVLMSQLVEYFAYFGGKYYGWQTERAKYNGTRMYSNYAVDLGLLAKSGDSIYLTPEGLRFTIQMQLHKSLKMVDSLKLA